MSLTQSELDSLVWKYELERIQRVNRANGLTLDGYTIVRHKVWCGRCAKALVGSMITRCYCRFRSHFKKDLQQRLL